MNFRVQMTHINRCVSAVVFGVLISSVCIWAQDGQVKQPSGVKPKRTIEVLGVDGKKMVLEEAEPPLSLVGRKGTFYGDPKGIGYFTPDDQSWQAFTTRAKERAKQNMEQEKKMQEELDDLLREGKIEQAAAIRREIQMRHLRWQLENVDNFVAEYFEHREALMQDNESLRKEVKELRKEVQSLRESLRK